MKSYIWEFRWKDFYESYGYAEDTYPYECALHNRLRRIFWNVIIICNKEISPKSRIKFVFHIDEPRKIILQITDTNKEKYINIFRKLFKEFKELKFYGLPEEDEIFKKCGILK